MAQEKKKSMFKGGGLGALFGQAIGGDTESTLIGGAIGATIGHVIGNKKDKKHAEELAEKTKDDEYHHQEVDALGGTRWQLKDITPKDLVPEFKTKIVYFREDGSLETITTDADGELTLSKETYRVVDNTLVVNKPGYIVNARFKIDEDLLIVSTNEFSAVLKRIRLEGE
jgi:hypothetical protein